MFAKTRNVRRSDRGDERLIDFEVHEKGHVIHAQITAEAVLGMGSDSITAEDEARALELVKRDANFTIGGKVIDKFRAAPGSLGTREAPVWLDTKDFPR